MMFQLMNIQIVVFVIWITFINAIPLKSEDGGLSFILLHNNDLHGRFDETTIKTNECRPEEALANKCYGGFARISTLVKRYRNEYHNGNGKPVLFLNGGDTYVGTTWFHVFKDKISSEFMNLLKPDVATLGNHEFDFGIDGLLPFLEDINFPVAVANLNITTDHPLWKTNALDRSVVFNLNGTKVGVIGYILPETETMSKPQNVGFLPEIDSINKEADILKKNGVNIIIALGHSGYEKDQEIAKECPLVDVVVGAHSHTFLYSGKPPDPDDVPLGPYPTVVQQKSGKKVPIVQAYAFSKYLGKLELNFDKDGNLLNWEGHPILLDNRIPRDSEALEILAKYRPTIDNLLKDMIGYSKVDLERDCFNYECNIGNLITDAWVESRVHQVNSTGWTDASIAFINAGAIRTSATKGGISKFTLSNILPFNNSLLLLPNVSGRAIRTALEYTVKDYEVGGYVRTFFQMSGARVTFDLRKPTGHRLQKVEVLCSNCSIPKYEPLYDFKTYGIIIDSFVYRGGDGFTMFKPFEAQTLNMTTLDAFVDYIRRHEVIYPAIEGRITVIGLNQTNVLSSKGSSVPTISMTFIVLSFILKRILYH